MAGPWFVDPENGLTTNDGLSTSTPWKLIPGQTGASAQTGYGVVAGDTINIRNGTTADTAGGRVILPANNLTYRGYGLASNVLELRLPLPWRPVLAYVRKVAREWGAHEGMWRIDATGITDQGPLNYTTRTGCVVEDVLIENARATTAAVVIGTSAQAQVGATMRRSCVKNAVMAFSVYRPDTTLEDILIDGCEDDGLTINTTASQSLHADRFFTGRRLSILNCGRDTVSALGDAIQMTSSSTGWAGTLNLSDIYIDKPSGVKQGIMLGLLNGAAKIDRFYFEGQQAGAIQIGLTGTGASGNLLIRNGVVRVDDLSGNAFVRLVSGAMAEGSIIEIRNAMLLTQAYAGLFHWGGGVGTIAGKVYIRNCTAIGVAGNGLSYSGAVSAQTTQTLDAAAELVCENNVFVGASPVAFRLPSDGLNDARWKFRNNSVYGATNVGYVGAEGFGTAYATVADFEAAHDAATDNTGADPLLTATYRPKAGSPLLGAGTHLGYTRDINRRQRPNPPSIGAYDAATLRTPA
jgi:hypothetical protein